MKYVSGLWIVLVLISACVSAPRTHKKPVQGKNLTLLYQSSRYGDLEPCGCKTTPYGGVDREFNLVNDVRANASTVIYADAGNSLAPRKLMAGLKHHQLKADTLLQAMQLMQVDVFAPGPADLSLGVEYLLAKSKQAHFPFVSSNIFDAEGNSLFRPYAVVNKSGVRIAFLSATPKNEVKSNGLKVADPLAVLPGLVKEIQGKSDLIVVLSQLPTEDNQTLLNGLDGVSVLIAGDAQLFTEDPIWFTGGKLLVDGFDRGYRLGRLDMDLSLPFKGFYSAGEVYRNQSKLAYWSKKLKEPGASKKAQEKIDQLKAKNQLSPIEGGSRYFHVLLKPNEQENGSPNKVTDLKAAYKEAVRNQALSQ